MPTETRTVRPGKTDDTVVTADGATLKSPADWKLLPPGDAGLTRRVKAAGPHWVVQEKKGRRTFSKGVWASAEVIAKIERELSTERSTDAYAKKRKSAKRLRDKKQATYVDSFETAVRQFLDFDQQHDDFATSLASLVTQHATPVGSGTVARTERIPIERRAESAVIAWMRHQTTAYDNMKIPRVKGKRREVRRMLAEHSRRILDAYRRGEPARGDCPLKVALVRATLPAQ